MLFADDKSLEKLRDGSAVSEIVAQAQPPHFTTLVLSDVHLDVPNLKPPDGAKFDPNDFKVDTTSLAAALQKGLDSFIGTVRSHGRDLGLEDATGLIQGTYQYLINCGDLLNGVSVVTSLKALARPQNASDKTAMEAYQIFYEKFALVAMRKFQERYGIPVDNFLGIPGNHDVYRKGGTIEKDATKFTRKYRPYYEFFSKHVASNSPGFHDQPPDLPCFSLLKIKGPMSTPLGYVAFVGFDSNWEEYEHDFIESYGKINEKQLDRFEEKLIPALADVTKDAPLYIVAVIHHHLLPIGNKKIDEKLKERGLARFSDLKAGHKIRCVDPFTVCLRDYLISNSIISSTTNSADVIRRFQNNRVSIVLHGHMHENAVQEVLYHQFAEADVSRGLTVLACPSLDGGTDNRGFKGLVKLGFDFSMGQAQIDALCKTPEQKDKTKPIQVIQPLLSASRVTAPEVRLYNVLKTYLGALPRGIDANADKKVEEFQDWVERCMSTFGYTPVCAENGESLDFLTPERHEKYLLLLLLREDTSYSILLNRHVPLRLSQLADWDTLLLPAFKSVHELLRRIRDDMLRQRLEFAEDAEDAQSKSRDLEALAKLIGIESPEDQDQWTSAIRFVATKRIVKFSPTEGVPTEYDYSLVTLEPLVREYSAAFRQVKAGTVEHSQELGKAYAHLRELIEDLPRISTRSVRDAISVSTLEINGGGLRWDPVGSRDKLKGRKLPQGAMWFPIRRPGDTEAPFWQQCPSIKARNADVMTWVDNTLQRIAVVSGGAYPDELVLGKWRGDAAGIPSPTPFPFQTDGTRPVDTDGYGCGTVEALGLVRFETTFDLKDELSYGPNPKVARVILKKSQPDKYGRCVIQVFDASHLKTVEEPPGKLMGILRPAQRYVLRAGIRRAERINNELLDNMNDPWGFIRVKLPASFEPFAITPPILEELDRSEREGKEREFIVCDGNHRIVQRVWLSATNEKQMLQAIAILGKPRRPFYAKPFSKYEWHVTAENMLAIPPDTASKYAVRAVSELEYGKLDERARGILRSRPKSEWYRRYFRDLSTGFGYMGGQGGRPV